MSPEYAIWRPAFAAILDPRRYTIAWLDDEISSGRVRFRATDKAAIATEFRHYPTGACDIHGLIAAGDVEEIASVLIPEAEQFAREKGAIGAIIESRPAWKRVLKGDGYQPYQLTVRKDF